MSRSEEWNEFLGNLLSCAQQGLNATKEYEYLEKRQAEIDKMLETNLNEDQKIMVDEVLLELGVSLAHETELIYRQGLKDCVWLLKNLGVLT